jgi:hypothetical protein
MSFNIYTFKEGNKFGVFYSSILATNKAIAFFKSQKVFNEGVLSSYFFDNCFISKEFYNRFINTAILENKEVFFNKIPSQMFSNADIKTLKNKVIIKIEDAKTSEIVKTIGKKMMLIHIINSLNKNNSNKPITMKSDKYYFVYAKGQRDYPFYFPAPNIEKNISLKESDPIITFKEPCFSEKREANFINRNTWIYERMKYLISFMNAEGDIVFLRELNKELDLLITETERI